mmetsp:Transcript_15793/g.21715  ORF Transcript_15793/g.21715 Transcript_15793/m.21715 type:complete len:358 (+) Transcript_15793:368-1441(+)
MTTASKLGLYYNGYFTKVAKEAGDDTVVLLIDDVQNNWKSFHWNSLLKGSKPTNLLVISVGVPQWNGFPQFDHNYPSSFHDPFLFFLTCEDLPEVCSYFIKAYSYSAEVTNEVCGKLLEFTSGHLFPFVTFAQHLFDPNNKIDLTNVDHYLSGKEFRSSAVCMQVRSRCYEFLINSSLVKAENLLLNKGSDVDRDAIYKLGVWKSNRFFSPFLTSEVFLQMKILRSSDEITLDETQTTPYAQQIISAGLRDMTEEDFKDVHYDFFRVESAMCFRWAYRVASVLCNVRILPQARTQYVGHAANRAKPVIDFYFNGRLNLGIEVELDLPFMKMTKFADILRDLRRIMRVSRRMGLYFML